MFAEGTSLLVYSGIRYFTAQYVRPPVALTPA